MLVRHTTGLVCFEVADDAPLALALERRELESSFDERHAAHPQYAGWAQEARLCRMLRKVGRTKGGSSFERGQLVLAHLSPAEEWCGLEEHWTVYCPQTGHNVAVALGKAEEVAA